MGTLSEIILVCCLLAGPDTTLGVDQWYGGFEQATRIAVAPDGSFCVIDAARNQLMMWRTGRTEPVTIGGYGWGSESFDRPTAVVTDGLNLYVADHGNHRIVRFDRALNPISSLSTRDTIVPDARFGYPLGVALSRQGDLFVLDGENRRIVKFSQSGLFELAFAGLEIPRARLKEPVKVLVDASDRVCVLDAGRIVQFDYFGGFLGEIPLAGIPGVRGFEAAPDGYWLASDAGLVKIDMEGREIVRLSLDAVVPLREAGAFEDVAIQGDKLYLVFQKNVGILRMRVQ